MANVWPMLRRRYQTHWEDAMIVNMLLVFCGGMCGVLARFGITQAIPTHAAPFPLATGLINICGAFLLGLLVAILARAVPDTVRRARWRACLGTGFLGGFTTYSALTVDSMMLSQAGHPVLALWYYTLSVILGTFAAWAGVSIGGQYPRMEYPSGDGTRFAPMTYSIAHRPTTCPPSLSKDGDDDTDSERGRGGER
ncbi:MAG: CrcB family protein [Arcanobacterium sp.]|nr:CrcB family protein [Arcanobacterium sp.]